MVLRTKTLEYTHNDNVLEAYLAWDDATSGARPGALVSHAWAGRSEFENNKAEALAELGYAGFALDLYGKGVLGSGPEENAALMQPFLDDRPMLQQRLRAALDAMHAQDVVDANRTAVIGYCFGGLCALDMARTRAAIVGAISVHGLFTPLATAASSIDARILALHGWDDPLVTPDSVIALATELSAAGADWQLHAYGNTMHAFTDPEAHDTEGGVAYDATADRRSWQACVNFLAELF